MHKDAVVEDVRRAGARLAEEAGNDLHVLCENLRKKQTAEGRTVVRREPRGLLRPIGTVS